MSSRNQKIKRKDRMNRKQEGGRESNLEGAVLRAEFNGVGQKVGKYVFNAVSTK